MTYYPGAASATSQSMPTAVAVLTPTTTIICVYQFGFPWFAAFNPSTGTHSDWTTTTDPELLNSPGFTVNAGGFARLTDTSALHLGSYTPWDQAFTLVVSVSSPTSVDVECTWLDSDGAVDFTFWPDGANIYALSNVADGECIRPGQGGVLRFAADGTGSLADYGDVPSSNLNPLVQDNIDPTLFRVEEDFYTWTGSGFAHWAHLVGGLPGASARVSENRLFHLGTLYERDPATQILGPLGRLLWLAATNGQYFFHYEVHGGIVVAGDGARYRTFRFEDFEFEALPEDSEVSGTDATGHFGFADPRISTIDLALRGTPLDPEEARTLTVWEVADIGGIRVWLIAAIYAQPTGGWFVGFIASGHQQLDYA